MDKRRKYPAQMDCIRHLPVVVIVLHSLLVFAMATLVATEYTSSLGEVAMGWFLFLWIDFPFGWAILPLSFLLEVFLRDTFGWFVTYVIFFGSVFLFFGGLQYYLLSKLLLRYIRYRVLRKGHLCTNCGYDLRGTVPFDIFECPECGYEATFVQKRDLKSFNTGGRLNDKMIDL